ncbi:hypothetical protein SUNI508_04975 [Seiridium unicorne]|uniref:Glycoside hydrolase family 127 protein n=1 Tax=Seiridium unicorne TaxID=138068 RepID=A0ABR2V611_9PEZI
MSSYPQVTFPQTVFHGPSVLKNRRKTISGTTVKAQLDQLRKTGRYDSFKLQWHPIYDDKTTWPATKSLFWDSDIAKWIEGACYILTEAYDAEIDAAIRELVEMIRGAQQPDGYLNIYFTVVEPKARWTNIRDQHELYNAGHLIEAALAHENYYKNGRLLEPIITYVKYIHSIFGPGENQRHAYPGHPEIELALLRLYSATGNQDAYDLAKYFLEERGNPTGQDGLLYYDWEEEKIRGDSRYLRGNAYPMARDHWYNQAHLPILQQKTVEGHAVRAMYLYTAVADLLHLDQAGLHSYQQKPQYFETLQTLWNNMVDQKMYVTGGIGAINQWEGFGQNYFLPQGTDEGGCYNETCASIGLMMLAERMLHLDLDSRYGDIMELQLYNTVMTAMSLDGTAFTYVNQLASSEKDKNVRETWFECSCCPPNLMRLYGSLGGYLWDFGEEGDGAFVNVHLYTTATVRFPVKDQEIELEQESNWPWEGRVSFKLKSSVPTTIRLRIPAWSKGGFELSPQLQNPSIEKGYLTIPASYTSQNPSFTIDINGFKPRLLSPHPYTNQNTLALARGPVVYCVEDFDNKAENNHFKDVTISADAAVKEEEKDCLGEKYVGLRSSGRTRQLDDWATKQSGLEPGSSQASTSLGDEVELVFVPYYLRANRGGKGHMRVGLLRGS